MMGQKEMTRKKTNKAWWIIISILAVILIAGILVWFMFLRDQDDYNDEDFFDPMAVTGILPDMSEEEIQEELNRVVEEGMLNISIASEIRFEDGGSKGLANISNTAANNYIFKVTVTLDDTDETVYQSGGIKPGQYIQYIELEEALEKGEYPATAVFTAYTQDTHQIVGSAGAQLTLYVEN